MPKVWLHTERGWENLGCRREGRKIDYMCKRPVEGNRKNRFSRRASLILYSVYDFFKVFN
jgi:hypothetical protein